MSIRLMVTMIAAQGKGNELAEIFRTRCANTVKERGCEQYEIFQSVANPDRLVLLEKWTDEGALAEHSKLSASIPPMSKDLRVGSEFESYTYNRTR